MLSRRLALCVSLAALTVLGIPAAAGAANRYAMPGGATSGSCDVSAPCTLERAVNAASAGDDVTLAPGSYSTTTTLGEVGGAGSLIDNLTIHGAPGARPVITYEGGSGTASDGLGIELSGPSATLRDVIVNYDMVNGDALFALGGTVERVTSHVLHRDVTSAGTACGAEGNVTFRDDVCWTSAPGTDANATAFVASAWFGETPTVIVRNVTAIADDPGPSGPPALKGLVSGTTTTLNVNASNVIARSATGTDVAMAHNGAVSDGTLTIDHSNYATKADDPGNGVSVVDGDANQTAAPVFVDAPDGDFRQAATSTGTLNLGTATGVLPGELDLEGQARFQGAAPDIGADEFPAAPPGGSSTPSTTLSTPVSPAVPATPKKCRKGFVKKKVHGKRKCRKKRKH